MHQARPDSSKPMPVVVVMVLRLPLLLGTSTLLYCRNLQQFCHDEIRGGQQPLLHKRK